MKTTLNAKKYLQYVIKENPESLRAYVAEEVMESENIETFFSDLSRSGCVSGVTSLIYYVDTHAFFDKYQYEIAELKENFEDSIGEPVKIEGDIKNWLAWFAFEQTAYELANEIGFND